MIKDKIRNLAEKKLKGNSKKTVENLIVFLILLVITIISINLIWGEKEEDNAEIEPDSYKVLAQDIKESNILETTTYNLEEELESILSKISGVRKSTSFDYIFRNK